MQRLNSDGQQFYQYKQNEHTPPILTEVTENKNKDHNVWLPLLYLYLRFSKWTVSAC
jgi:hypothetical protein